VGRAHTRGGFGYGLLVSGTLTSLGYKAFAIGLAHPADLFLSWALDVLVWAWLWLAGQALDRGPRSLRRASAALCFYFPFHATFVCSFAHDYFFAAAAERRMSLVDVDLGAIVFFFTRVLPERGLFQLLALLVVMHGGAFWISRRPRSGASTRSVLAGASALTLVTLLVGTRATRFPSPLFDIAHDFWELARTPRIELGPTTGAHLPLWSLDKSQAATPALPGQFKKVLVFVMETMTADKFERERAQLAPTSFVRARAEHFHAYSRYFPNNQDSRTGMLDMLSSRVVPYEAYTEQGRDHYRFLANKPSLVDRFRALGYTAAFAVSQTDLELVVSDLAWNRTIELSEADIRASKRDYLCFVPYEFEHGCEDRVLLPPVFDLIDRNERVFLYQEFIWGHDIAYNRASGKTDTEYYSGYVDAVVAHLEQRGLLDQTLIVLTSDHGFRDKGLQGELTVYRIPLLFYAPRFQALRDERLFSHIDFKDLLFHELAPGSDPPADSAFVMIVGTTGTGMLTALTREHELLLFKRRRDHYYLLRQDSPDDVASAADRESPAAFLGLFERYRRAFDAFGAQ
jgi:hypothetical protein